MQNLDIRVLVSDANLKYKDIAAQMGISKWWLSKLMSHELTKENRSKVMRAIMELKGEKDVGIHTSTSKGS